MSLKRKIYTHKRFYSFRKKSWPKFYKRKFSISTLMPSITTLLAICVGMTGMRMALAGKWDLAVACVLFAAFLDVMDGRLARFFNTETLFGVELDSLADVINFGVVPSFIIYSYSLKELEEVGWGFVLFFTVCAALRLARFNIQNIERGHSFRPQSFFMGTPTTIAAFLTLVPIVIRDPFIKNPFFASSRFFASVLFLSGVLMISRIPTFSLKRIIIPSRVVPHLLSIVILIAIFTYIHPRIILSFVGITYVASIPVSSFFYHRLKKKNFEKRMLEDSY
ncbi:MAG: CDP-alcohol phosphatidyltransferase family protein [Alphaproteobacteria bacterium]